MPLSDSLIVPVEVCFVCASVCVVMLSMLYVVVFAERVGHHPGPPWPGHLVSLRQLRPLCLQL